LVQISISIFSVTLIILIKKIIKLSWNRFPVWWILWKNGCHFLRRQKKHHVQQNVHNTVVLPSTFCADIIFSLGNMKLFVSFSHITAVKRCHSQIVLNTNCTPTLWIHNSTKRCKKWFICYNCTQNKYFYTKILKVIPQCCARYVGHDVFFVDARNGSHFVQNGCHFFIKFIKQGTCSKIIW
jgi:hypothetical protein